MGTEAADVRVGGLVFPLAITQTIGYGALYYAFAVLLTPLAAGLGTSIASVTGALTVSVLTGAALAVPIGRILDRHGGRALMTAGSAFGALCLLLLSRAEHVWQLYLLQAGIGAAGAASLYEAAFAVLIARLPGAGRANALLAVTVVAGFASTIFLPLTGWLTDAHGWRTTLVVLAAVQAATIPLHALAVPRRRPAAATHPPRKDDPGQARRVVDAALRDRGFWLLAIGFTAHTAAISALTVHLVAALVTWGHPPAFAATVAGLLGALSVAGRLLTTGLQRRYRIVTITATVFAVQAVAAAALALSGTSTVGAIGGVIAFGIGFGVATIAKPMILTERYGTGHYATLAGAIVLPATLAKAAAPLTAAALQHAAGYGTVLLAVGGCCAVAAAGIAASGRHRAATGG